MWTAQLHFLFRQLDLLAIASTSKVVVDLVSFPGQTPLSREKDTLVGADGVSDCHRSR
jgi:hypothetical protein